MNATPDSKTRQDARARILDLIDRRRQLECDCGIGAAIEHRILAEECETMERSALIDNVSHANIRIR
jgi:hypothetical protein